MSTTQPIKSKKDLIAFKNFYLKEEPNLRNYALICTGINTALRISDILHLTWKDVYDFKQDCFRSHLTVRESKTKKENIVALNKNIQKALLTYKNSISTPSPCQYIFPGKTALQPLSRCQAFRVIKHACEALHFPDNISCHSLRKTFGYHAWASGVNPTILMLIFNHSSFQITKRYLGIDQADKDEVFLKLNL